ncbi:sensor histidine kinase [Paenibacillus abyssi]|uniref:Sensor histidine kinase YesM n=1 Tax=Paenibacillus abyssi TaxID=1340531 RepID=A0A917FTQ0_9BACL|nr:sensor histidine kinase [Paenibacillus abyssi]GGG04182.1 sensor histidine kinase YesM [Paenibacillus abyssi]
MIGSIKLFNRFATKMIIAFVVVILIPALFTSASFYMVANRTVKDNVRESSIQIAKQAADSLSFILNAGSDVSDQIYSDMRIQHAVSSSALNNRNDRLWRENEEYLKSALNNMVYSSSFVNIVYVLKSKNNSWGSGTFSKVKLSRYEIHRQDWVKEALIKNGSLVWMPLQNDQLSGGGDNTELVLPLGRVLKDFETMENIGYIHVNINGKKIIQNLQQMVLGETGGFFVVNEEGRIMVDPNPERINTVVSNGDLLRNITENDAIEFEYAEGLVPHYGVKQRLSNGWLIVGTVPIHEITDKLDALHHNILLSFAVFTLGGILIGFVIASRVTRPIKQLTRQMKLAQQGDLSVRTEVHSKDEFGLMSRQFNRMMSDIDLLMNQVALEQRQKQDAELRVVTHRINPHFLFNTLSTLRWLIKYNQTDKANEGISALIRLLDANMGKKGHFVTIEEELDIIEKYLAILELRYNNKFNLNIKLDPDASQFLIPRMMIQPIVENSIFHGIVPKGTDGEIDIEVQRQEGKIIIIVKDNGIGILPEKQLVEKSIREAIGAGQTGIGLRHVFESIELYFDRGSEFTLTSADDEGTTARLILYSKAVAQGGEPYDTSRDRR